MVFRLPTVGLVRMMYFFFGLISELKKSCAVAAKNRLIANIERIRCFISFYFSEPNIAQFDFMRNGLNLF
jgi:hypothetical protein